ncbi:MAG: hypothetical protein RLZ25_2260 [Pseudomonadota bacterium]|jgi:hypothetical protein
MAPLFALMGLSVQVTSMSLVTPRRDIPEKKGEATFRLIDGGLPEYRDKSLEGCKGNAGQGAMNEQKDKKGKGETGGSFPLSLSQWSCSLRSRRAGPFQNAHWGL